MSAREEDDDEAPPLSAHARRSCPSVGEGTKAAETPKAINSALSVLLHSEFRKLEEDLAARHERIRSLVSHAIATVSASQRAGLPLPPASPAKPPTSDDAPELPFDVISVEAQGSFRRRGSSEKSATATVRRQRSRQNDFDVVSQAVSSASPSWAKPATQPLADRDAPPRERIASPDAVTTMAAVDARAAGSSGSAFCAECSSRGMWGCSCSGSRNSCKGEAETQNGGNACSSVVSAAVPIRRTSGDSCERSKHGLTFNLEPQHASEATNASDDSHVREPEQAQVPAAIRDARRRPSVSLTIPSTVEAYDPYHSRLRKMNSALEEQEEQELSPQAEARRRASRRASTWARPPRASITAHRGVSPSAATGPQRLTTRRKSWACQRAALACAMMNNAHKEDDITSGENGAYKERSSVATNSSSGSSSDQQQQQIARSNSPTPSMKGPLQRGMTKRNLQDEFMLLPAWLDDEGPVRTNHENLNPADTKLTHRWSTKEANIRVRRYEKLILNPTSPVRVSWDVGILLMVLYDCAIIPMQFFDLTLTPLLLALTWITRIFWTADIFMSFATGYVKNDGLVEMDVMRVSLRYLRTWFAFDLMLVIFDWFQAFSGDSETADTVHMARLSKTARTLRILRLTRLLRLLRIQKVMQSMHMRIRSEKVLLIAGTAKIVVIVVGAAHLLACGWYAFGRVNANSSEPSWLKEYNWHDKSLGLRYTISFHWSLAQFSGLGFDEVHATNIMERLYAIVVTFISFVVGAYVISNLTTTMTRLHILASTTSQQVATLRRYLTENKISQDLSLRVQRNAQHCLREKQKHTDVSDVALLKLVSEPLQAELHFELHSPVLSEHAFLKRYCEVHPTVMRKVCHTAVTYKHVSAGDVVFTQGEMSAEPCVFFFVKGSLEYTRTKDEGPPTKVERGEWAAEANLWTTWMHRGTMRAVTECRLLLLDALIFMDLACQFWTPEVDPKEYAQHFVASLNDMEEAEISDLTIVPPMEEEDDTSLGPARSLSITSSAAAAGNVFNLLSNNSIVPITKSGASGGEDRKVMIGKVSVKSIASEKRLSLLSKASIESEAKVTPKPGSRRWSGGDAASDGSAALASVPQASGGRRQSF